ncbi:MAG: DUF1345 domain-containing protein [Gemmatimonadota bacterium]
MDDTVERPEPRWPAMLAALCAVALHFALPAPMRVGPPWVLAGVVGALVLAAAVARRKHMHRANSVAAYAILAVLTIGLLVGVAALIRALVQHNQHGQPDISAAEVLSAAAVLWTTNVIVFATLYWRLDAGGPNARERREAHTEGAFLFPQMTFDAPSGSDNTIAEEQGWRPHFVDYLFVAFNTSTAFSPTDAPVLSKWAKLAMMVQAIISFTTVVLIAARAVNIL